MKIPPAPGTTSLFLIRHGATAANESVPFVLQGKGIDLPLSPRGVEQAAAVSALLGRYELGAIYSSGMLRARQTAGAIAAAHDLPVLPLENLHECDVGRWEGKDWGTVQREFPDDHRKFLEDPAENPNLGGESYGDVLMRVDPVLRKLLRTHAGQNIVVVAHNVVNRVFLAQLLGIKIRHAASIRQANGCANLIQDTNGVLGVTTLNATFHLETS